MSQTRYPSGSDTITLGSIVDGVPWSLPSVPNTGRSPLGIVLSNPCDLQWGKADLYLIAILLPAKDILQQTREFQAKVESSKDNLLTRKPWDSLSAMLEDFIHNKNIARFFFIDPDFLDNIALFVDFQFLISLPVTEYQDKLEIKSQLVSPYREKLIVHFANYTSRIGVDRLGRDLTDRYIERLADPYRKKPASTS